MMSLRELYISKLRKDDLLDVCRYFIIQFMFRRTITKNKLLRHFTPETVEKARKVQVFRPVPDPDGSIELTKRARFTVAILDLHKELDELKAKYPGQYIDKPKKAKAAQPKQPDIVKADTPQPAPAKRKLIVKVKAKPVVSTTTSTDINEQQKEFAKMMAQQSEQNNGL